MKKKKNSNSIKNKLGSGSRKWNKPQLISAVKSELINQAGRLLNYKQICKKIGIINMGDKRLVVELLEGLAKSGVIQEVEHGRYRVEAKGVDKIGFINYHGSTPFFMPDGTDGTEDIPIDDYTMDRILNKDKVRVRVVARKKPVAQVINLIERSDKTYIGTLQNVGENFFFIPNDKVLSNDVYIHKNKSGGADTAHLVAVKITDWPNTSKNPEGEVIAVLGKKGDNNAEMNAILMEYGLPYSYPKEIEEAAEQLKEIVTSDEVKHRADYRNSVTFTIDPADAKDFDDALSIDFLPNGNYKVGVHIADVSYFVLPDDIIDKEAYKRATSIYLVDRTIPMLPERLCNDLCSLKPNVDRFAYSCIFEIDTDSNIINYEITRAIINSDRRFSYEEAQEVIEGKRDEFTKEILTLNTLAQKLRKKRFDEGSIGFERQEMRFELDEKGHPIAVKMKISKEANKMIEEFMLLANRTVAKHIATQIDKTPPTFVYRVHDRPDMQRMESLSTLAKKFGHLLTLSSNEHILGEHINQLIDEIKGKPEQNLLSTLAIRSMAKAVYSTKNIGHYGLSFDFYTHFTSPIRRYPDLMVHRLLTRYMIDKAPSANQDEYETYCDHSSNMEQLAASAERASIKYKQVEYMKDRLGNTYDGVISGITEWGIYVELKENHCEGMIPIRSLGDDYYVFDEENYTLVGNLTKKRYTLGDNIRVTVASANLDKKQLDLILSRKSV